MVSRSFAGSLTTVALLGATAVGCDDEPFGFGDDSAIVFGLALRTDPVTGASEVEASHELLRLGGRGFDVRAARVPGGSCNLEDLAGRRGSGRFESGRAVFTGGALPPEGLVVRAEATAPALAKGAGWKAGDLLGFAVEGFALPSATPFRFRAPSPTLVVTAPAAPPNDTPTRLSTAQDLVVTWTPPEPSATDEVSLSARGDAVMVAITIGENELRCFFDRDAGRATVPRDVLAALRASDAGTTTGTLAVAAQRQVTLAGRGGWLMYVVATAEARRQGVEIVGDE